jgi:hypothetical protein
VNNNPKSHQPSTLSCFDLAPQFRDGQNRDWMKVARRGRACRCSRLVNYLTYWDRCTKEGWRSQLLWCGGLSNMPILLIVHRCCSTVTVALVSSVGESLGVTNRCDWPWWRCGIWTDGIVDSESCYHEGGGCDFAFKVLYVLIPTWVCGRWSGQWTEILCHYLLRRPGYARELSVSKWQGH